MWVKRMRVAVIMGVAVGVIVVMPLKWLYAFKFEFCFLAGICAWAAFAEFAICHGASAFGMMMMAFLRGAHLSFKAQNLRAVFAELAVHGDFASQNLLNALNESVDHLIMIIEIGGFDKFDLGMCGGHFIRRLINPVHQNSGEQEIRKHDDALISQFGGMFERWGHERERHTGISCFGPTKAEAFPQHACDFGYI